MDADVSGSSLRTSNQGVMTWCSMGALAWIGLAILRNSPAPDRWPVTATAAVLFLWMLFGYRGKSDATEHRDSQIPPAHQPVLRWWPPLLAAAAAFWVVEPLMLLVALSLLTVHGLHGCSPRWFIAIFGIGVLMLWPPGMWTDGSASYDATAVTLVSQGLDLFQMVHVPLPREIRWGEGQYPIHRYLVPGDGLGVVLACSICIVWLFQRSLFHAALLALAAIPLGWLSEVGTDYPIFLAYGSEPSELQVAQASWIASLFRIVLLLLLLLFADRLLRALLEPIDVQQLDATLPPAAMELNRWIAWPNVTDSSGMSSSSFGGDHGVQEQQSTDHWSTPVAVWAWSSAGLLSLLAAGLLLTERIVDLRANQSSRSQIPGMGRWHAAHNAMGIEMVDSNQSNPLLELNRPPDWIGKKSTDTRTIWIGTRQSSSQRSLWEDEPRGRSWTRQEQRWRRLESNGRQNAAKPRGTLEHLLEGAWKQTSYRGAIEGNRSIWTSIRTSDGNWRNPYRDQELAGSIEARLSHHLLTRIGNLWSDSKGVESIQMAVDSVTPWTQAQLEQLDEVYEKIRSELFSKSGTGVPYDASLAPSVDAPAILPRDANHVP
jgi:hypothetical protein